MSGSDTKAGKTTRSQAPAADSPEISTSIVDCWNKVGVEGDGSCPELERFVHCRNCPVYSKAGAQLLDRTLPPGYRQQWTEYFADKRKPAAGPRLSLITFRVGAEWLALPTQAFQEVAEPRPVHSIPHRRHGVLLGLVNIRGELLLCVSVARLLGLDHTVSAEKLRTYYDRLLIVLWDGKRLAFPVDEVHGICRLHPEELVSPPATTARAALTFIQGIFAWQDKMVGLLEPESFFSTFNRNCA